MKQAVDITIEVMKDVLGAKVNPNVEDQIRAIAYQRVSELNTIPLEIQFVPEIGNLPATTGEILPENIKINSKNNKNRKG